MRISSLSRSLSWSCLPRSPPDSRIFRLPSAAVVKISGTFGFGSLPTGETRLLLALRVDPMAKRVPAYSLFVEAPEMPCSALQWFRDQELAPNEHMCDWGAALYFSTLGELHNKS